MSDTIKTICDCFWANTQVSRKQIFGIEKTILSINQDAQIMWAGCVGSRYVEQRVLFIAHFPAGGTQPYEISSPDTNEGIFYNAMKEFKDSTVLERYSLFQRLNSISINYLPEWRIFRVMNEVFKLTPISLDDTAYINAVPYRIEDNRKPNTEEARSAWFQCTSKAIVVLRPRIIVCLGQATSDIVHKFYSGTTPVYTLRRRIGDNSIDPSVQLECKRIAEHLKRMNN